MEKKYTSIVTARTPRPRSERLRKLGGSGSGSGGSTVVNITGGGTPQIDGHTHSNFATLERLGADDNGYLYVDNLKETEDGNDWTNVREKAKAGHSDNSDLWDDHDFNDYIDQPVRRSDDVGFRSVTAKDFQTRGFVSGIETGTGAAVDAQGNAEVTSLTSRSWIKSPYLIYNKVQVTGGEMWNTEGGTIASVEPDGDSGTAFVLTMELEDGDVIDLQVDDICKGHYNSSGGFVTSYFRVTNIDQPAKRVRIVTGADSKVPGGRNHPPLPFMNIARYGNFTDKKRQRSQYFSSSEGRIALLDGVDQYIIEPRHYKLVIGEIPQALLPDGYPLAGDASIYLDNVLARNFFQIDKDGKAVRTIRDRGLWSAATAIDDPYQCNELTQDDVYHISCKWRCLVEGSTAEPRYDSPDWLLLAGDTTLSLDIESSEGDTFLYGRLSTTLKARVRRGVNDITADILPGDWTWTRDTGDVPGDAVWNTSHAGCTSELSLTNEDLAAQSGRFVCEVYVRDGAPQTLHAEVAF